MLEFLATHDGRLFVSFPLLAKKAEVPVRAVILAAARRGRARCATLS